jgi:hypothetical protein
VTSVFLSPEWIASAEQIYERHRHHVASSGIPPLVVNFVVTGAPFLAGEVEVHTDTSSGDLLVRRGKAAAPDLTFRVDYDAARSLVVDQDPQLVMEALILGRIRVEGDLAALSAKTNLAVTELPVLLTSLNLGRIAGLTEVDPVAARIAEELRAITA